MDKQMIEEMAEYIFGNAITHDTQFKEDCRSIARDLICVGYQRISENEVVLTKEEYNKLRVGNYKLENLYKQYPYRVLVGFNSMVFSQDLEHYEKLFDDIEKRLAEDIRKETAEKFAEMLKAKLTDIIPFEDYEVADWNYDGMDIKNSIDEICKKITEGK